ncbi:MAG: hypothetical protein MJ176_01305 [Treponema sp.]|nr:hypothetical protein [Treponema sp.]
MKKIVFFASLAFLFFFSSCNFFQVPAESKNGSIVIDLGKNSRAVTFITRDSVGSYSINVSGKGYSETKPAEAYETVVFEDLEPGTYTVKGLAFSEDNKLLASASTTVTIKALDNVTAKLNFHDFAELSTRFGMFYYDDDYGYLYYPYDDIDDIDSFSLDMSYSTDTGIKDKLTVYEMPDSKTYIIVKDYSEYKLYLLDSDSDKLPDSPSSLVYNSGSIESIAFLASDPFDSYLLGDTLKYDIYLFTIKTENSINTNTLNVRVYPNDAFPSNSSTSFDLEVRDPIAEISKVVVRGSLFFISYKSDSGESRLAMVEYLEEPEDFILHEDLNTEDLGFTDTTEIRDMAMPRDGELYLLVGENGFTQDLESKDGPYTISLVNRNFSLNTPDETGISIKNTTIYNRGALVKMGYSLDGEQLNLLPRKTLGWYNTKRTLNATGTFTEKPGSRSENRLAARSEFKTLDLYAPTKRVSSSYFYGPVRFVCTKPDELYIVDSGFNIRLADWNATDSNITDEKYDRDQKGLTSNVFNYERIIKVDLGSFAMSVEKSDNASFLYTDASFSGDSVSPSKVRSNFYLLENLKYVFAALASATAYLGIHPNPVEPLD